MSKHSLDWRRVTKALVGTLCCSAVTLAAASSAGQPLKPAYLSQMPPTARILAEIKGKNPEDTIERQMGAFQALQKLIDDMAWGLEKRYLPTRATPDENRIKLTYGYAYADLWHKALNKEDHLYDHDQDLLNEMLGKFFPPEFRELYFKSDANAQKGYQAFFEKSSGAVLSVGSAPAAAPASKQDEVERLCAAKGLDMISCSVRRVLDGLIKTGESMQGPPGLRMSGGYQVGQFSMVLDEYLNAWINCGDVVLMSKYDIARQGNRLTLHVENANAPITLALGADGTTLTGPATVAIHGRAPGGSSTVSTPGSSQQVTTTQQRTLTPLEAQQYPDATRNGQTYTLNETTSSTEYAPGTTQTVAVYTPKTLACKLGVMPVRPISPADAQKKPEGITDYMAGMLPPSAIIPNGIRMAGTYVGQGGGSIQFLAEKAVVGCRATQQEHPYSVDTKTGQLLIQLSGAGGPSAMTLGADSSLHGPAAILQIQGRRKTGENALGEPVYAASSDSCSYGTLAPKAASN